MSNDTQQATTQKQPAAKTADRTPIPIERLLFTSPNVHGIKLPHGPEGKGERILPSLTAGIHGDEKIDIEHRPWLRVFRVAKSKRISRTGVGKDAKEIVTWEPIGKPYQIPDSWAVSVPVDE